MLEAQSKPHPRVPPGISLGTSLPSPAQTADTAKRACVPEATPFHGLLQSLLEQSPWGPGRTYVTAVRRGAVHRHGRDLTSRPVG